MQTRVLNFAFAAACLVAAGCAYHGPDGSTTTIASPTSPTAPAPSPSPSPSNYPIAGQLTAVNGGQPLAGVLASLGAASSVTDSNGNFTVTAPFAGTARAMLSGDAIVPRELSFAVNGARNLRVSAIAKDGVFDLAFYRQLVRDGYEAVNYLEPLRRWTKNPSIYLRTVDDAGAPIDPRQLDSTERTIMESVPVWTAGQFVVATVVRGAETRANAPGWLTVVWPAVADPKACGRSEVGGESGTIQLFYKTGGGCRCGDLDVRPLTVRHEVGHAMGFWHTGSADDVMAGFGVAGCDKQPSARERYHAAIAYSRPVGNVDPDTDPSGAVSLAPTRVIQ